MVCTEEPKWALNRTGPSRRSCWEAESREAPSRRLGWFAPHVYRHPGAAGLEAVWLPLETVFLFEHPPRLPLAAGSPPASHDGSEELVFGKTLSEIRTV